MEPSEYAQVYTYARKNLARATRVGAAAIASAGLLAPLFRRQIAWRVLEGVVATTMWTIASLLLWRELSV